MGRKGRPQTLGNKRRLTGRKQHYQTISQEFDIFMNLNLEEKENADLFTMNNSFEDLLTGIYAKTGFKKKINEPYFY
ncbi:MAG: hypothetical protein ACLU4N_11045 [Butyricimonas faecihominis]